MAWYDGVQFDRGGNTRRSGAPWRDNRQKPPKRSGCKLTPYKNGENEEKVVLTAWNKSMAGFLSLKAYPMTQKGAEALGKVKGYDKSYSNITAAGNERWFYEWECKHPDRPRPERGRGIATWVPSKKALYVSALNKVAKPQTNYFGTFQKPRKNG